MESMVEDVRSVFRSGKTKAYEWRASQLTAILKITTHHEAEIVEALRSDLNKPEYEAFVHEINGISSACKFASKELRGWMKRENVKTSMNTYPSSGEIVSEPLGTVLVISTWNYPFMLSLGPVIGAIAAGNAVVLKPSEVAPATSSLLSKLLGEYMDTSAVKVVEGGVQETTALLEQKWDKIFYTGNGKVGRVILSAAARHLTPVVLELGGKCPLVVDSNIDLKVAARRIISGKWGCNSGQTCISPDYVVTTKAFASTLVDAISFELEKFYGKDPLQSNDLSSIINSRHFERLEKLLDDEKVSGTIVVGGQRDKAKLKIAPTVLLDVPQDSLIMSEEIFGPLLPIITVPKIEDSIALIMSKEKPLAAYLFTNDEKLKEEFIGSVSAGGMCINESVQHHLEHGLPFGGVGESGMGAYHGKFSFDAFSHKKAVLRRGFNGDIDARYPPYTARKLRFMKAILGGNIIRILRALFGWTTAAADDDVYQPRLSFPVLGNVYPDGQYNVTILIGDPPLPYTLDIDTGSDLTWVQCDTSPCQKCYPGPHPLYKKLPSFDIVYSNDPLCRSLHGTPGTDGAQCDYEVNYADGGSSMGVLVRDNIKVTLSNGTIITPVLAFGCGYDQEYGPKVPLVDGILGLGKGGSSILAQLGNAGVTRNFVAHCFSSAGGGYLTVGAIPLLGIEWKPILKGGDHYFLGPADIVLDGQPTDIRDLQIIFDSGSTYTYLPSTQYEALLDLIQKNILDLVITTEDQSLPVCWKGDHAFTSVSDAATHFKTLALNFTHGEIVAFELRPESYLVVSGEGNPCLGILNGTEVGLEDTSLIGDISMQDKLVLYDNDNSLVGWATADCNRLP